MDLNTVQEVVRPASRSALPAFADGDAFLAGGTWLFSEPQTGLRRLIDLASLRWPALETSHAGLTIAATCPIAVLEDYDGPGAELIRLCCRALLGSFKIKRAATVGGNLCLALPASPMAAMAAAMDGVCTVWRPDGGERTLPASALIAGANRTSLAPAEVLRSVFLPDAALRRRCAFRQTSLTPLGRSAALLIGARDASGIALTITASVARPVLLRVTSPGPLSPGSLSHAIDDAAPAWFDDVHGAPGWRRRITHLMAAEIVAELA